jgi:hypothetical protein
VRPTRGLPIIWSCQRSVDTVYIIRIGQLRAPADAMSATAQRCSDCATVWDCSGGGGAVNRHPVRRIPAEDAAPGVFMSPSAVSPSKWLHFALFSSRRVRHPPQPSSQSRSQLLSPTWRMRGHAAPRHPIRIAGSPRGAEPSDRIPQLDPVTRHPLAHSHPEVAL